MTVAIALVAASVICHATWNLLAKQAGAAAGPVFVGLWSVVAAVVWAPLGLWSLAHAWHGLRPEALVFLAGALVLHTGYYLLLQRGYQIGDLSVVYPIARGLGPALTCVAAVPLFGEQPGLLAWVGAFGVAISVAVLGRPRLTAMRPVWYAVGVGVFIAGYTLWDKAAVAVLPPILLNWGVDTARALLFAPWLVRRRHEVRRVWRQHRRAVIGTAICSPAAYILVLTALTMAPVTLVAPLREVSVVLVVFLGARLLGEKEMWRRLTAAIGVVAGAVAVTIGRS